MSAQNLNLRFLTTAVLAVSLAGCGGGSSSPPPPEAPPDNVPTTGLTIPTTREDGTELREADIETMRVYYGIATVDYQDQFDVDTAATEIDLSGVVNPGATYFYVVTTIDTDGRESLYSAEQQAAL